MSLTDNLQTEEDKLSVLVGEGKKYKNAEELARAYFNANAHINELRDDLDEMKRDQGLLQEVLKEVRQPSSESPDAPAYNAPASEGNTMTPDEVANIAKATLESQNQLSVAQRNQERSFELLEEFYGSKEEAASAISKVVATNDATKELVDRMADTDPELLFRTITGQGDTPRQPVSNTPGVTRSASSSPPKTSVSLPWSEAQRMRKSQDPKERKLYNSVEYKQQIEQAAAQAESLGIDYFAT